jgi:hypothetical protein
MVKPQAIAINTFKSSVKGTFIGATSTTALATLLATALYINDNYSSPFAIFSKYYFSLRGFAFGIVVPVFVGAMTTALVLLLKYVRLRLTSRRVAKIICIFLIIFAYFSTTFLGSIVIIYLGG